MSRGAGKWQRIILEQASTAKLVGLRGNSRSETVAIGRAARLLASAGKVVIVRLWNDSHTAVRNFASLPGTKTKAGKPIESLSVAIVPAGTRTTFKGSIRDCAYDERVSKTTIARDIARTEGKERRRCPYCNRKM